MRERYGHAVEASRRRTVASKRTLSADNLEALGARRLAELLMDVAGRDAAIARRLRLELAAEHAPGRVAADVRKRLAQIGRARSFADRGKVRELAIDLDTQRRAIVDRVAGIDAAEALELMWRLLDLASAVHERSDDSDGVIGGVFATACNDLGPLASAPAPIRPISPIACSLPGSTTDMASSTG